jgi:hypothetical protein
MQSIKVGDKIFTVQSEYDDFQMTVDDIGELTLSQMPTYATIKITGLKKVDGVTFRLRAKAENTIDGIFHQIGFIVMFRDNSKSNGQKRLAAIKQHFKSLSKNWEAYEVPQILEGSKWYSTTYWLKTRLIKENKPIINHFKPVLKLVNQFKTSKVRAFLCHSSKDKAIVEKFATKLQSNGSIVWFDKWEIKVGDSIVEKVDSGLQLMTHLLLFLSNSSVNAPWVKKEFSAGLMRKLTDNSVRVIPILLDKVKLPTIISDIKYANCIDRTDKGFEEIIEALLAK